MRLLSEYFCWLCRSTAVQDSIGRELSAGFPNLDLAPRDSLICRYISLRFLPNTVMLLRNIGNIPVLKHFRKTPFTFGNSPLGDDLPIDYRCVMSLIWSKVVILGMSDMKCISIESLPWIFKGFSFPWNRSLFAAQKHRFTSILLSIKFNG